MIKQSRILDVGGDVVGQPAQPIFQRPDEILGDDRMNRVEKRALLAALASDARAVPNAPWLRRLDDGKEVSVDDVLGALNALDATQLTLSGPSLRGLSRGGRQRRWRLQDWTRLLRRRSRDDDDDPPPCSSEAAVPPRRGSGGAYSYPEPALA